MEKRELTCINCPMGCLLTVEMEGAQVLSVTGNQCKRGDIYARKEVVNPVRVVTATVKAVGGVLPVVSVKTKEPIPKGKIFDCMEEIRQTVLTAPVQIGETVLENVAGTGVAVVVTRGTERK